MCIRDSTNIARGVSEPALDRDKKWDFVAAAKVGDEVSAGEVLGTVEETIAVTQRIMVPYKVSGKVKSIESGSLDVYKRQLLRWWIASLRKA